MTGIPQRPTHRPVRRALLTEQLAELRERRSDSPP